jgi:hypothetical protein
MPFWSLGIVHSLQRWAGELLSHFLQILVARRSQDHLQPCSSRKLERKHTNAASACHVVCVIVASGVSLHGP